MRVYIINRVIHAGVGHDRQDRSEDFLLHHLHVVGDIANDRQRHFIAVRRGEILACWIDLDQFRTLFPGIGKITLQALMVPSIYY